MFFPWIVVLQDLWHNLIHRQGNSSNLKPIIHNIRINILYFHQSKTGRLLRTNSKQRPEIVCLFGHLVFPHPLSIQTEDVWLNTNVPVNVSNLSTGQSCWRRPCYLNVTRLVHVHKTHYRIIYHKSTKFSTDFCFLTENIPLIMSIGINCQIYTHPHYDPPGVLWERILVPLLPVGINAESRPQTDEDEVED